MIGYIVPPLVPFASSSVVATESHLYGIYGQALLTANPGALLALRDEVLGGHYKPQMGLREVLPVLQRLRPFLEAEDLDISKLIEITSTIPKDPTAAIGAMNELTRVLEGFSGERQRRKYRKAFINAQQSGVLPKEAFFNPKKFDKKSYHLLLTLLRARREADQLRHTTGDRFEERYDAEQKREIGRGAEKTVFLVESRTEEDENGNPKKYIAL